MVFRRGVAQRVGTYAAIGQLNIDMSARLKPWKAQPVSGNKFKRRDFHCLLPFTGYYDVDPCAVHIHSQLHASPIDLTVLAATAAAMLRRRDRHV
jgi:hypothetical protein